MYRILCYARDDKSYRSNLDRSKVESKDIPFNGEQLLFIIGHTAVVDYGDRSFDGFDQLG